MPFDIVLPSVLFFITVASAYLSPKLETKIKALLEERKFRMRDVVLLVLIMGVAITVIAFAPNEAILVFFLLFYSVAMFTFVYSVVEKWHVALMLPAVFLLLYFFFWGTPQMDIIAAIFIIFVSVYLATLFEWKTLAVFAGLLTIMDIIHVFGTGFMVVSSIKMVRDLQLPIMIKVPSFPYQNLMIPGTDFMGLGLGDFFLCGLLSIQAIKKYGRRFGYIAIAFIAAAFLIFEAVQLWYFELWFSEFLNQAYPIEEAATMAGTKAAMPATIFIVCGWLVALGARYVYNSLFTKKSYGEKQ